MLWTLLLGLTATWTTWSCVALYRNYKLARTTNLPIILEPVSSLNIPWLIFNQLLKLHPVLSKFRDRFIRRYMRFSYMGWQFDLGWRVHEEIGPAFVLVSPGMVQVVVADTAAACDILARRKDFVKPAMLYEGLKVFGPNLNTAEGEVWQRHRRLTAPSFNEKISSSVWREAMRQSEQMLAYWKSFGPAGVASTVDDTATLTLHVLTACGFDVRNDFHDTTAAPKGHQLSYKSAIMLILRRLALLLIFPMDSLSHPLMPKICQELGIACKEFKSYVGEMLAKERALSKQQSRSSNTLLANLVRASDAETNSKASIGLSDQEINGNMFIFTLAGHETTANTVATALFYLARYPDYQEWMREELRHVLGDIGPDGWNYDEVFPRLKRCLAVMHETLRLHGSIMFIPKSTNAQTQHLNISGSMHTIPASTSVYINNHASQVNPNIWGTNANSWRPDRWVSNPRTSDEDNKQPLFNNESLLQPVPGAFIPWADGPRICPGKKFSQVEFVAAMATLFNRDQVLLVGSPGETSTREVNAKLDRMLSDSELSSATLQMRQPGLVKLAWTRRAEIK